MNNMFNEEKIDKILVGYVPFKVSELTENDMPSKIMKDVFTLCGVDTAVKLLTYFQGNVIQIPTRPWQSLQEKYIIDNYDNTSDSIKLIARSICVSEKFIRDVLKKQNPNRIIPSEGQRSIFDELSEIGDKINTASGATNNVK